MVEKVSNAGERKNNCSVSKAILCVGASETDANFKLLPLLLSSQACGDFKLNYKV